MLNARENYLELLHGGKPERFVNQYEFMVPVRQSPYAGQDKRRPGATVKDAWGTTILWKEGDIAAISYVTEETKVCPDICRWDEYVKAPPAEYGDEDWAPALELLKNVDRSEKLVAGYCPTGLFERLHFLMGFEDTLMGFLEEPEAMHALLDYLLDWRMRQLKCYFDYAQLDIVFLHDDWGAKDRLFFSPDIWREFFKPRYAKLYEYVHQRGGHIVHHADSYLMPIVPEMVEIGIDNWQGVLPTNDIVRLQKELGGKIILMGGIDCPKIDVEGWTEEAVRAEVARACKEYAPGGSWIPCVTYGNSGTVYGPIYDIISDEIDRQSKIYFK